MPITKEFVLSGENGTKESPMNPPARIFPPAVAVLVISLIVLPGVAVAASVQMNPVALSLQQGSTTPITLTLDSAPDGLAGYRMNISLSNPASARITGVSYPSWAVISNTTGVPGSAVRISGVDLGKNVEKGAASVPLATITLQALGAGTCRIITSDSRFDADGGAITLAVPTEATVTVSASTSGGTTSGGSTGGVSGGGSSGSYTGSIVEQKTPGIILTSTPTPSATMAVVSYATPEGMGTVPATTPETSASGNADTAVGEQHDSVSGSGLLFRMLIIGAGILVLAAIGAFVYLKKKE
jgi:hypothetical protein